MESIVSKALARYFKKFIKDFKSEQFSVSLLKGKATLTDLELDGAFIQQVMMIPPNTEIRSCSCNELNVYLPGVTKFNEKPVVLELDKVYLNLEEPETIKPVFPTTSHHRKKSSITGSPLKSTKKGISNFVRDMKIVINEAHFAVKLLPRDEPGVENPWAPHLTFDFVNIIIESTNGEWKVVKLSQAPSKDETKKIEQTYKLALCRSVSISLITNNDTGSSMKIVDKIPLEIHVSTKTLISSGKTIGVDLYCILDELHFSWNQLSWGLVVKLFSSLRFCLEREIPREIKVESKKKIKKQKKKVSGALDSMEMRYRLLLRTWSLSFLTGANNETNNGYRFSGSTLQFNISPKRKVSDNANLYESHLNLSANSFTFGEITPNKAIEERVNKVIAQVNNKDEKFINIDICHKWAKLNQPKATELNINLIGVQIVLDREAMKGFYKFLSGDIITIAKEDHVRSKEVKKMSKLEKEAQQEHNKEKIVEKQVEEIISKIKPLKMSDYFYWFNSSDVKVNVENTTIIVPKDYYQRPDGIQLKNELAINAKKISFINLAKWNEVPHLSNSLQNLTKSELQVISTDSSKKSNKFQLDVLDVVISTQDPISNEKPSIILEPAKLMIYGRFLEKVDGVEIQPDMELVIHASNFELKISEEQEDYFKKMIPMYKRWYHKLNKEIKAVPTKTKQGIKKKISEGKKTAIGVATKLAENNATTNEVIKKAKKSRIRAVEDAIKSFQCSIVFKAALGSLQIPLHNYNDEESIQIEDDNNSLASHLSNFKFEKLEFILENTLYHQCALIKLGVFEAKNLDHPKSPSSLSLLPLTAASDYLDSEKSAFSLECTRSRLLDKNPFTSVIVFLQGMQIVSQAKKNSIKGLHKELEAAIPDLKRIGQKITDLLVGLKQDKQKIDKLQKGVDKVKKNMSKGVNIAGKALSFLDLSWSFNVSDCEFVILEHDWTPDSHKNPFGCIKVSNFNKDKLSARFEDLNKQLIDAKLELVEAKTSISTISLETKEHEDHVTKLKKQLKEEKDKARKELETLEQELINAKLSLVEAQVQVQDLETKLLRKK